jgi:hypothetical protein
MILTVKVTLLIIILLIILIIMKITYKLGPSRQNWAYGHPTYEASTVTALIAEEESEA